MLSTISTGVMGVVGLMMVFRTSKPFNTLRIVMMAFLIAAFAVCYFFFPTYFTIEPLNTRGLLVFIVFKVEGEIEEHHAEDVYKRQGSCRR